MFQDFCKEIKTDFDDDLVDNEALDLLLSQFEFLYAGAQNQNGELLQQENNASFVIVSLSNWAAHEGYKTDKNRCDFNENMNA